ncbi:putative reverse transcriptase zinc-binding domain-containing protein [Helianthus debilis subsp. tardiflorus]
MGSVGSIRRQTQTFNRSPPNWVFKWNNWMPKKVGIVGWCAMVERLPTRKTLSLNGIHPTSVLCPLCNEVWKPTITFLCHASSPNWCGPLVLNGARSLIFMLSAL